MSYAQRRAIRTRATRTEGRRRKETGAHVALLEQLEGSRDELLTVAVDLARRLRAVSTVEAEDAALEVNGTRRGLGESSRLEARVTVEVLSLVEAALRGGGAE